MPKFDPKYVRLVADYSDVDENGNSKYIKLPLHTCTEKDWASFYPPDQETENYLKSIKRRFQNNYKDAF